MIMTTPRKPRDASSLEREVITAVVVLYLVLSGAMLIVHFALGGDDGPRPAITSSTSPTHAAAPVQQEGAR
jgi:hypothetical protein